MRRLIAIIFIICYFFSAKAQFYGNQWINYSQKYVKFPIHSEGIYRIDSTSLSAHFNLSTLDPHNIQIFLKGEEQNIYIRGESDNKINTKDYIEFYANTEGIRVLDSLLYYNCSYLPSPYLPIFNDTIYAFITVNNSVNNKRYQLETDTNAVLYNTMDHFYSDKVHAKYIEYNGVYENVYGVSDPRYTQAEGRGSYFNKGASNISTFSNLEPYTTTPINATLFVNYSGATADYSVPKDHFIRISYSDQTLSPVILKDTSFTGFVPLRRTFTLNTQNLNTASNFTIESLPDPSIASIDNYTYLHYFRLIYPKTNECSNSSQFRLNIENSITPKGFYNFSGFNFNGTDSVLLYDITNGKKIRVKKAGNMLRAVIPNGINMKMCYLASESKTIAVNSLRAVNGTGYFNNYKLPGVSNPYVIIHHPLTKTSSQLYQSYRQSLQGGSYQVINANVNELYEQFAFGNNKHPVAIRNFLRFMKDSLAVPPKYVFLIGKAVGCEGLHVIEQVENLIPTMGIPSCDNLLASALSPTYNSFVPEIPIGRLSAYNDAEVSNYLLKVQQHESSPPAEWKKRVLHFVGGADESLTATLSGFMKNYGAIITDTLYGGDTLTFRKNTTAPIQINISDSIKNAISNGAGLINFFGHGSDQGFDQAIDDPEQYNNASRYPFVIANSCYSGNIHIFGRKSVSERFVFASQKGSIGFLASTSVGFVHSLNYYTTNFYKALSATHYNKGLGDITRESAIQTANNGDLITKFTALDMTLHGDPAVRVSVGTKPDYILRNSDISFDLKKYTDSVGIKIDYRNMGMAVKDSIFVRVERYYPNGDSATVYKRKLGPYFRDQINFYMLIDFSRGIGLNKFKVKIDDYNEVSESLETNNTTIGTVDLFIPGGDILPVYPYKYAVVPKTTTITLKASTTDPFAPLNKYRIQIDTNDKFTNPFQSTLITSKGGVIEWNVNLPFKDSTVYFWRVSRDSTSPTSGFLWKESSFQTINTKRGWAQAHFNQFKNDGYQFVKYKKTERLFAFENSKNSISCRNGIYPYIAPTNISYFVNNIVMGGWGCAPNGWNFVVFDSISGLPWIPSTDLVPGPEPGPFNNCHCQDNALGYYSFGKQSYCGATNWKQDIENFLNNSVPNNNYVLAYTLGELVDSNARISTYANSLYTAFEKIGAVSIRTTADTVPYILFGKKGMLAGQGHEVKGINKRNTIWLYDSIQTRWKNGYIASEIIGPSSKWNSLHWRIKSVDAGAGDTTILKVVGIKKNGQIDTLKTFPKDSMDVIHLDAYANASVYPYLKLIAFMKDPVYTTAPQLKRWQVLYDEAPECALNPLKGFAGINDTLQEGDKVTLLFPIENVGVKNFEDSLVVTYWIEDNSRNSIPLQHTLKPKPFVPGQIIVDTVRINSYQLAGNNALWIHVNPTGHAKYQYEQYQFNNIGRWPFKVTKDITNPLLDVTFDGVRILNGDIVSAKPNILVSLKDENKFLELNDTAAFTVSVFYPGQSSAQKLFFAKDLQFTPASLPKNSCTINYNPTLNVDGKYTLVVTAKDRSANRSGTQNYQVQFEVQNKATITNVMNYPNPFTTSTRFVFTLTGSDLPEVFTIQIMTITGKIVKEITREELGHLHIGRNITDYAWDGRDMYGDRLGNGVYLYRVVSKLNGESIEKSSSGADKFFVKDFGKMVLMR